MNEMSTRRDHMRVWTLCLCFVPFQAFTETNMSAMKGRMLSAVRERKANESQKPSSMDATPQAKRARTVAVTPDPDNEGFLVLKEATSQELRPSATLTNGQCFHWKPLSAATENYAPASAWGTHNASEWIGVLRTLTGESLVLIIRETKTETLYKPLHAPPSVDVASVLHKYFHLDECLQNLYQEWSRGCPRLARLAACIPGCRILDQDPFECLISFICSTNNNIPRITKILQSIRQRYGEPIMEFDGDMLYSFPSLDVLLDRANEMDLRQHCGLGYRAKYIIQTLHTLQSLGGESYLQEIRALDDPIVVQQKLCQFAGVGLKVADCVALFSLQQSNAIPVDVHVWNIALRDYDSDGALAKAKSLTPKVYWEVGECFRSRFPRHAGWAHSLLFVAELPSFRAVLPEDIAFEMDRFREDEQHKKQLAREAKMKRKEEKEAASQQKLRIEPK